MFLKYAVQASSILNFGLQKVQKLQKTMLWFQQKLCDPIKYYYVEHIPLFSAFYGFSANHKK